ncbi:MAG: biotin--[acetyl-CoA-carboxylase] ligase [Treponema sp.]|nr:biotin--[acetyl-CoA-carboxylase] ligase [Treponema sp.]
MKKLEAHNPFSAPVYHEETVISTMDVSRKLAAEGGTHGTVITSDFQEAGRGRIRDRLWEMDRGASLPFTILLRYSCIEEIPVALTLRAGLAVSLAIEDFAPSLQGKIKIKWPNDILIESKKTAGILCEAESGNVYLGIGINMSQNNFSSHLQDKATSIVIAAGKSVCKEDRFSLLEKILLKLHEELENNKADWKSRLEQRLFKLREEVTFFEGAADRQKEIKGFISGIGDKGELLIKSESDAEATPYFSGEISFSSII